jgi:dTDP-4-amino-4,6-dideoxygalactose transaminase
MAAMGLVAIRYVDEDNAYRRTLSAWYDERLDGTVARVPVRPGCESARHLYQILVERRDEVMLGFHERGIYPGVHYRDNAAYPMYATARGACPRARDASERVISLPLHLRLTRADVDRVSTALRDILSVSAR